MQSTHFALNATPGLLGSGRCMVISVAHFCLAKQLSRDLPLRSTAFTLFLHSLSGSSVPRLSHQCDRRVDCSTLSSALLVKGEMFCLVRRIRYRTFCEHYFSILLGLSQPTTLVFTSSGEEEYLIPQQWNKTKHVNKKSFRCYENWKNNICRIHRFCESVNIIIDNTQWGYLYNGWFTSDYFEKKRL